MGLALALVHLRLGLHRLRSDPRLGAPVLLGVSVRKKRGRVHTVLKNINFNFEL